MKNRDLIERLQMFDADLEVLADGYEIVDVVQDGDLNIETAI